MEITTRENDSIVVFLVSGEITGVNIIRLSKTVESILGSHYKKVILDLTDVNSVDSCGLGGIIYANALLNKEEKTMVLAAPEGIVKQLLLNCALDKILAIIDPGEYSL